MADFRRAGTSEEPVTLCALGLSDGHAASLAHRLLSLSSRKVWSGAGTNTLNKTPANEEEKGEKNLSDLSMLRKNRELKDECAEDQFINYDWVGKSIWTAENLFLQEMYRKMINSASYWPINQNIFHIFAK